MKKLLDILAYTLLLVFGLSISGIIVWFVMMNWIMSLFLLGMLAVVWAAERVTR